MPRIFATATLRHLAGRHRLRVRDLVPGASREAVADFLRTLLGCPDGVEAASFPPGWIAHLEDRFLVEAAAAPVPRSGLPFAFVEAINFELTYGCNLACSHCLQDGLRPAGKIPWVDAAAVARGLEDASWLGLTQTGVNFTGGEVYLPASPVLDLIELASGAGINVRCNTNAWWGNRTDFTVGRTRFASHASLVEHLQEIGLTILVMSLDSRYEQYPDLLDRVISVAACCEERSQLWEMVATSASPELMTLAYATLVSRIGRAPRFLIPTPMDTVDLGAASGPSGAELEPRRLAALTAESPCQRKGFYRPHFLHVNPAGGVRSCLYAPGVDILGNLARERFPEILNRADRNPVIRLFSEGSLEDFVETNLTPWKHLYRDVKHACAASALIARVAGALAEQQERTGRDLTGQEMEALHAQIASGWNLSAPPRAT